MHNLKIKFKFDLETLDKKRHLVECPVLNSHDFYHLILFFIIEKGMESMDIYDRVLKVKESH